MKKLFLTLIVAFATAFGFAQENITVEYPYYETINTRIFDISKVIADKEATVLEVYFYAVDNITVDANTVLVGNTTGKCYKLLRSEGPIVRCATIANTCTLRATTDCSSRADASTTLTRPSLTVR